MRPIIFDFDGVIVDSEPVHEVALRAALARFGLSLTHEEFVTKCLGVGDRNCLVAVARGQGREVGAAELDAMMEIKRAEFLAYLAEGRIQPYAGTIELMRAVAGAGPIAVCSGSGRGSVEPVLRWLGIREWLAAVITADDVAATKPDPAGYLLAARRLGATPGSCTALEDTPTGIRAALAAGMRVAAVAHTLPAGTLAKAGAHKVFAATAGLTVEALTGV